ncbi:MAG: hypothetical protein ABIJ34_05310 [archaeon]
MDKRLISLVIILFIVSCTSNSGNVKLEKDIYKGTSGIVLNFFDMPKEVFENEELTYSVKIENKGPYPVANAKLLVSLEKGYAEFKDNGLHYYLKNDINMDGKTIYNLFDDFKLVNLPIKILTLDAQSETHDSVILTTLCYDYEGQLYTDICIDTDPHGLTPGNKACAQQTSISLSEGQGGPVVISKIDTKMLMDDDVIRPQFKINIVNQGKGTVTRPGAGAEVCDNNPLSRQSYNTISLSDVEISGRKMSSGQIECIPSDLILRNEEDFLTCTVTKQSGIPRTTASYLTPLQIKIKYGYTQSTSKEISINKILKY